jgi:hypothetical protein
VQFLLDGAAIGTEDLAGPYSTAWNSTTASNGSHALAARARDAAGNQTTTTAINVIVNNAPPPNGAAIVPGQVVVDPPTLETLGVALPIGASDTNHNATVQVTYRRAGDPTWLEALPLFRVRPEFIGDVEPTPFTVDRQFAGSIFDLAPDTEYEIMLDIRDPDGGNATRTVTARTRAVPLQNPATPRVVAVSTLSALNSALAAAAPGDVISIADGVYNGAISISNSGTAANPIFVRGKPRRRRDQRRRREYRRNHFRPLRDPGKSHHPLGQPGHTGDQPGQRGSAPPARHGCVVRHREHRRRKA